MRKNIKNENFIYYNKPVHTLKLESLRLFIIYI